jgi:hypothetical protein
MLLFGCFYKIGKLSTPNQSALKARDSSDLHLYNFYKSDKIMKQHSSKIVNLRVLYAVNIIWRLGLGTAKRLSFSNMLCLCIYVLINITKETNKNQIQDKVRIKLKLKTLRRFLQSPWEFIFIWNLNATWKLGIIKQTTHFSEVYWYSYVSD